MHERWDLGSLLIEIEAHLCKSHGTSRREAKENHQTGRTRTEERKENAKSRYQQPAGNNNNKRESNQKKSYAVWITIFFKKLSKET